MIGRGLASVLHLNCFRIISYKVYQNQYLKTGMEIKPARPPDRGLLG
jgi:hypothetical protein